MTLSGMRVGARVHSLSPSEDRKEYLGSWDTPVCFLCRVSSLGVRNASQSVVVPSHTVLGAMASDNPVLGSWALSNSVSEVEISRDGVKSALISSIEVWG